MANTLSPTMTLREFENGYWYVDQLKNFAERIAIPGAKKANTVHLTHEMNFLATDYAD